MLRQLEADFDNVRAAWHWAIANGHVDALLGSAQTLWSFCVHRGRVKEGLSLFSRAIDSACAQSDPVLGPRLSSLSLHFLYQLNRYGDAEATATLALAASRLTNDHETQLQCVKTLGAVCLMLGRYSEARGHYRQALRGTNAITNPNSAAAMLDNLALVEIELGNYTEALHMAQQSLVQHQRLADVGGEALCFNNIGSLHISKGEYELARLHLNQGLAVCERHGLIGTKGVILANLTELAVRTSDPVTARAQADLAIAVAVQTGHRANQAFLRLQLARIALKETDLVAARANLHASLELAIAVGRPSQLMEGVCCFAEILELQGELDCARRLLTFAIDHSLTATQTRNDVKKRLAQMPTPAKRARKRASLFFELDGLAHRILVETPLAHAPLISELRGVA